jgi:hybrid cluster-associated redox disulfide protein
MAASLRQRNVSRLSATSLGYQERHMRELDFDNPDMPLADLMTLWPETVPVFLRHRMLCVGCLVSPFHTVVDACREYDLDEEAFVSELCKAARL